MSVLRKKSFLMEMLYVSVLLVVPGQDKSLYAVVSFYSRHHFAIQYCIQGSFRWVKFPFQPLQFVVVFLFCSLSHRSSFMYAVTITIPRFSWDIVRGMGYGFWALHNENNPNENFLLYGICQSGKKLINRYFVFIANT